MDHRYSLDGMEWRDIENPTEDIISELADTFSLPPHLAAELETAGSHNMFRRCEEAYVVILHFPVFRHNIHATPTSQEVIFLVAKERIATIRYEPLPAFDQLHDEASSGSLITRDGERADSPAPLFAAIMGALYTHTYHQLEGIEKWLNSIEENIFRNREREMVFSLSYAGRRLIDMKKMIRPHKHIYALWLTVSHEIDPEHTRTIERLKHEYERIARDVQSMIQLLDELRSTNNAMLSTKQSETMQTLTVLVYSTFPVTMIAALFSMNATNAMPFVGRPFDFWIIITIILTAILMLAAIFKYNRWI